MIWQGFCIREAESKHTKHIQFDITGPLVSGKFDTNEHEQATNKKGHIIYLQIMNMFA